MPRRPLLSPSMLLPAEELLRLLTQHLGALGGAAGVGSAAAGAGGGGGGGGEGAAAAGAPPEMASLVDTIMQQLLSKEVLYQPMKASSRKRAAAVCMLSGRKANHCAVLRCKCWMSLLRSRSRLC